MALIAKNDPTRYRTRSVDTEHIKIQKIRSRRKAADRKEYQAIDTMNSSQLHHTPKIGVLPPPRTLQDSDKELIIKEAIAWDREFSKMVKSIEI